MRGVRTDSRTNGFVGALTYAYWTAPDWAVTISISVLDAEAGTSATGTDVTSKSAAVIPVLFGAKYAPALSSRHSPLRPYLSGAVGPYLGFASNTVISAALSNEAISETAFGFRALVGVDWFAGSHFTLSVGAGYHFVTDFDEPIGRGKNYSGPEFSFGLGFVFGKGR